LHSKGRSPVFSRIGPVLLHTTEFPKRLHCIQLPWELQISYPGSLFPSRLNIDSPTTISFQIQNYCQFLELRKQ
jgi:hypothetical protein